jgi:catechol 2,3-dioxygenase-like lactoylglutathione lyase family enzyme
MLFVKDLPGMAAFYETSLGLTPIKETRTDTWVEFDGSGSCFALHAIPALIAAQIEVSSPPQPRESSPVKLIFEVENLEMTVGRLTALGLSILQRPWGAFDGIDPEGNIFQIASSNKRR